METEAKSTEGKTVSGGVRKLTAAELKGISGLLLIVGVVFVAASFSYILGAWLGLMIIGAFTILLSKMFYNAWKKEHGDGIGGEETATAPQSQSKEESYLSGEK